MRVLVLAAPYTDLPALAAGGLVAAAWADLGHQAAVVPVATGGPALVAAVAGIPGAVVVVPQGGTSEQAGREVADATSAGAATVLVDLTGSCPADLGVGMVTRLTGRSIADGALAAARRLVAGTRLVAVVRDDERDSALTGVRGVAARRAYAAGGGVAAALAGDADISRAAEELGLAEPPPGAGAGDGAAAAVVALGGVVRTGPEALAELVGLDRSLAVADLVVVVVDALDFGGTGVAEVRACAKWAADATVPCVVLAGTVQISGRELRTLGVESAYAAQGAELSTLAGRVARTWSW